MILNRMNIKRPIIVLKQLQLGCMGMYTLNCKNVDMKKGEQGTMRPNDFKSTHVRDHHNKLQVHSK